MTQPPSLSTPSTSTLAASPLSHLVAAPQRFAWPTLLALYLAPGLAMTLVYVISAPLLVRANLPAVWGLLLGALLIVIPIELGIMLTMGKRATGHYTLRGVVANVAPLRLPQYVWLVPCAILGAFLCSGLVIGLEPTVRATLFGWLPAWFSTGLTTITSYSPAVLWVTVISWIVLFVLAGPIVEELYFRGFLLPRTPGGRFAPLINALLFALYHFWQPSTFFTILLFILPLAYLVWWRRNVYISMIAHCTVNAILFIALLAGTLQR